MHTYIVKTTPYSDTEIPAFQNIISADENDEVIIETIELTETEEIYEITSPYALDSFFNESPAVISYSEIN